MHARRHAPMKYYTYGSSSIHMNYCWRDLSTQFYFCLSIFLSQYVCSVALRSLQTSYRIQQRGVAGEKKRLKKSARVDRENKYSCCRANERTIQILIRWPFTIGEDFEEPRCRQATRAAAISTMASSKGGAAILSTLLKGSSKNVLPVTATASSFNFQSSKQMRYNIIIHSNFANCMRKTF